MIKVSKNVGSFLNIYWLLFFYFICSSLIKKFINFWQMNKLSLNHETGFQAL